MKMRYFTPSGLFFQFKEGLLKIFRKKPVRNSQRKIGGLASHFNLFSHHGHLGVPVLAAGHGFEP